MQINYAAAQNANNISNIHREKTSLFRCLIKPQIDDRLTKLSTSHMCGHAGRAMS